MGIDGGRSSTRRTNGLELEELANLVQSMDPQQRKVLPMIDSKTCVGLALPLLILTASACHKAARDLPLQTAASPLYDDEALHVWYAETRMACQEAAKDNPVGQEEQTGGSRFDVAKTAAAVVANSVVLGMAAAGSSTGEFEGGDLVQFEPSSASSSSGSEDAKLGPPELREDPYLLLIDAADRAWDAYREEPTQERRAEVLDRVGLMSTRCSGGN